MAEIKVSNNVDMSGSLMMPDPKHPMRDVLTVTNVQLAIILFDVENCFCADLDKDPELSQEYIYDVNSPSFRKGYDIIVLCSSKSKSWRIYKGEHLVDISISFMITPYSSGNHLIIRKKDIDVTLP